MVLVLKRSGIGLVSRTTGLVFEGIENAGLKLLLSID